VRFLGVHPGPLLYSKIFLRLEPLGLELVAQAARQAGHDVRLIDLQVESGGNWASLPDGRVFGRGRYGTRMLCDACGTRRGPVRLDTRLRLAR